MIVSTTALRHRRLRSWLLGVAVSALVWLQLLGALHSVAHAPSPSLSPPAPAAPALGPADKADAAGRPLGNPLDGLFAGHDRDQHCQLFDQLTHADLASWTVPDLPVAEWAQVRRQAVPVVWRAVRPRGFRARDPPPLA